MENGILISVVVPIYNAEKYLERCIESIINQTYTNLEIILVNDGSTDASYGICQKYAQNDSRIRILNKTNGGVVSARKAGVQSAAGDYIGYVDADDWIEKEMYLKMYQQGVTEATDIICVGVRREFEDGSYDITRMDIKEGIYDKDNIEIKLLPQIINTDSFFSWGLQLGLWSHLFKRNLVLKNQMKISDSIKMGEDVACSLPCYLEAERVAVVKEPLYHYRQFPESMKGSADRRDIMGCKYLYYYLLERMMEHEHLYEMLKKKVIHVVYYDLFCSAYNIFIEGEKNILFPYQIERGKKIVIYGAGVVGRKIYQAVRKNNFCEIVLWVDSRWEMYASSGQEVEDPEELLTAEYDYIVLAIAKEELRIEVKEELLKLGVDNNKLADIHKELLTAETLEEVFADVALV